MAGEGVVIFGIDISEIPIIGGIMDTCCIVMLFTALIIFFFSMDLDPLPGNRK